MKALVARNVYNFISGLPLNKLTDKPLRNALITNHLMLRKLMQELDKDIEELRNTMFKDHEAELQQFLVNQAEVQKGNMTPEDFEKSVSPEFRALVEGYNQEYEALTNSEKEIQLRKVELEAFTAMIADNNIEVSMNDVAEFVDLGLIEA